MMVFSRPDSLKAVLAALFLTCMILPSIISCAKAQSADVMKAYHRSQALYKKGKYAKAIPYAKRALKLGRRELGEKHRIIGTLYSHLAELYEARGFFSKAEPLYKRSLRIYEKALGPNHQNVAATVNNLGTLYYKQGRYRSAEPLMKRSIALARKKLGTRHPNYATTLHNLAILYRAQARYKKAEPLLKQALAIRTKALGRDHRDVGLSLNNLAALYHAKGQLRKAETLSRRALVIREKVLGPNHPLLADDLNSLAALYGSQSRYGEAEALYKRALAIRKKVHRKDHPAVATSLNNLATLYYQQARYKKAEPLYKRALAIREKVLAPNHPHLSNSLNDLATLFSTTRRYKEAEPLLKRAIAIRKKVLGPDHLDVGTSLNNLAALYYNQGHYRKAEPLYKSSLAITRKTLGANHPDVAVSYHNLAVLYLRQKNWGQASKHWRQATMVLTRRTKQQVDNIGSSLTGKRKSLIVQKSSYFSGLVKTSYRQDLQRRREKSAKNDELLSEMFRSAQWAIGSKAAGALAQMSARQAKGSGKLAKLVRERQDKLRNWQKLDKRLVFSLSKPSAKRNRRVEKKLSTQLQIINKRVAQIDRQLTKNFPEYAALANPKPLSVLQVQEQLGEDEALVLLLNTRNAKPIPPETFIWAVTKHRAVWKRAQLGGRVLASKIALLRKELDPSSANRSASKKRGLTFLTPGKEAGFSLETAHELYTKLLEPVEDVIGDKRHLMIVGSGPLTSLPFQVLVKKRPNRQTPNERKYMDADWLVRHHAITTLPSVASLKALRGLAKTAVPASHPLIGFADPVFSRTAKKPVNSTGADRGNRSYASFFRGRLADPASLAALAPLPGTRRELQGIGDILKIESKDLVFGRAASEGAVKKARLDRYRIIYFATHGLVSGEVEGLGEPALAFSVPSKSSRLDDGLLTASEVTTLKLNADWVVMSACNTASGDKPGAEALSGLARAFFYAGAKTLLVSHWPVGDEAAVKLTTHAFKNMQDHPKLGRSQALRQSMLALLNEGGPNAHPSVWAPFVVVGEGGR